MFKQGAQALRAWIRDGSALARALAREELRRAGFVPREDMERLETALARLEQEMAALRRARARQQAISAEADLDVDLELEGDDGTGDGA